MPQRRNPRLRRWQDRAEVALWYLGRIVRCGLRPRWHRAVANALGDASDLCNSLERELRAGWSKFREPAVLQARLNAVRRGLEAAWRIESGRGDDEAPLQMRDARRVVPRGHPRRQAAPLLPQLRSPHRHRAEPPAADVDHGVGQMIGVLLLACGLGAALVAWRNRR